MRPLGILGNLNNTNLNQTTDLFFICLYLLDEYIESQISERDKEVLNKYSKKLNKAINTGDFSEITQDFINELKETINNLGEL